MTTNNTNEKNTSVEGNLSIGRDVAVGGKMAVCGKAQFDGNVTVKGWLNAPNVRGAAKGLFATYEQLCAAYPEPHNGWFALVGDDLPTDVYRAWGGVWAATGGTGGTTTLDIATYDERISALETRIEELQASLAASVENEVTARREADTALTQLLKGTGDNASARDYGFIKVDDFAIGVTTESGSERTEEITKKFNDWLDGVEFTNAADAIKYQGRCRLGVDGRNVEAYNFILSYAANSGSQLVEGACKIGADGRLVYDTKFNLFHRTKTGGTWGAWQKLNAEDISALGESLSSAKAELQASIAAADQKIDDAVSAANDTHDTLKGYIDDANISIQDNAEDIKVLKEEEIPTVSRKADAANTAAEAAATAAKNADKVVMLAGMVATYADLPTASINNAGLYFVVADMKIYTVTPMLVGSSTYASEYPSGSKLYVDRAGGKAYVWREQTQLTLGGTANGGRMVELCVPDLTAYATTKDVAAKYAALDGDNSFTGENSFVNFDALDATVEGYPVVTSETVADALTDYVKQSVFKEAIDEIWMDIRGYV